MCSSKYFWISKVSFERNYRNMYQSIFKITIKDKKKSNTQPVFTGSKLTIEALEQGVKYVQS